MKNYLQSGNSFEFVAGADLVSGTFVQAGKLSGVATGDVKSGASGVAERFGVFTLPKTTGAAWSQGDQLYWDATGKKFTKVATGNAQVGVAFADAASGDATGQVLLGNPTDSLAVAS